MFNKSLLRNNLMISTKMNEFNREEVKQNILQAWKLFDILRSTVPFEDIGISLFLLSAYKDGFIEDNSSHYFSLKRGDFLNNIKSDNRYKDIVHIYALAIETLPEDKILDIVYCLNSLNRSILQKNFPEIFDALLYRLSETQVRFSGEFIQPIEISRFIMKLANLPQNASIYNPFSGLASFGIFLENNQHYFGQEINYKTWALGKLRLLAYNLNEFDYRIEDSIENWNNFGEFDLIVSNPPFNLKLKYFNTTRPSKSVEHFIIENSFKRLPKKGQLICLFPESFLYRGGRDYTFRKKIIDSGFIHTIISLPAGILRHTAVSTCILVFKKTALHPDKIKFVNGNNFVINNEGKKEKFLDDSKLLKNIQNENDDYVKYVDIDEIKQLDYNLLVNRYFEDFSSIGIPFNEIVKVIQGEKSPRVNIGKLVRVRDLKEDLINFDLDVKNIETRVLPSLGIRKIEKSCLLITTRWKSLKPTYFKYEGEPIYTSQDIIAFHIDESKVKVSYLVYQLHSDYIKKQHEHYRIPGAIPFLRVSDILNFRIELPTLEEQSKRYFQNAENFISSKVSEYSSDYNEQKVNVEDENSFLRHQIAGSLKNIRGAFKFIQKILDEKVNPKFPGLYNLKVSDELESTLSTYLNIIERDLKSINKSVNRVGDKIELMDLKIESFDLLEFLKDYVESLKIRSQNFYTVSLDLDENAIKEYSINSVFIEGDKDLLRRMLDNIIENAEKHGFEYGINNKDENKLEIFLMYDLEDFNVQIDISNTGNPLPESMTHDAMIRKGSSSGKSSGDGVGIWFVNEVMKIHKGKFGYTDETGPEGIDSEFVTTIELTFPIIPAI